MGKKITAFYREADHIGGLVAKIRLSTLMGMTSTEGEAAEDTPQLIAAFQRVIEQVRQEFRGQTPLRGGTSANAGKLDQGAGPLAETLRRHIQIYVELVSQRSLFLGDVNATVKRITEAAAGTLDIARVSVWLLDTRRTLIRCSDLYERKRSAHSAGIELFARDFPAYFKALESERTIAAHDAHSDPRTSCFSESYLKPLGITSMLDVPIWAKGRMVGVICHEHVGPKRTWTSDEENFAYFMSSLVALAMERVASA